MTNVLRCDDKVPCSSCSASSPRGATRRTTHMGECGQLVRWSISWTHFACTTNRHSRLESRWSEFRILARAKLGMRRQGHGYLNILCRCIIRRSATDQREHGFLLDQQTRLWFIHLLPLPLTSFSSVQSVEVTKPPDCPSRPFLSFTLFAPRLIILIIATSHQSSVISAAHARASAVRGSASAPSACAPQSAAGPPAACSRAAPGCRARAAAART